MFIGEYNITIDDKAYGLSATVMFADPDLALLRQHSRAVGLGWEEFVSRSVRRALLQPELLWPALGAGKARTVTAAASSPTPAAAETA